MPLPSTLQRLSIASDPAGEINKWPYFLRETQEQQKHDIYPTLAFQILDKCKQLVETKLHIELKLQRKLGKM